MKTTLPVLLLLGLVFSSDARSEIVLFADSFSDTGGFNDTPNNSVSGVFGQLNANNYVGRGDQVFSENGGTASVASSSANSGMLVPLWDFATNADVISSGVLTVEVTDLSPSSADWFAINFMSEIPSGNIFVNQSFTELGVFFRGNGTNGVRVFEGGGTGVDVTDWADDDIRIELTNMTGVGTGSGSFDYEVFSGATSLVSDSATGDLSSIYLGLESRDTTASTFSNLRVTTATAVPEPSSLALTGFLVLAAGVHRRRNGRAAAKEAKPDTASCGC